MRRCARTASSRWHRAGPLEAPFLQRFLTVFCFATRLALILRDFRGAQSVYRRTYSKVTASSTAVPLRHAPDPSIEPQRHAFFRRLPRSRSDESHADDIRTLDCSGPTARICVIDAISSAGRPYATPGAPAVALIGEGLLHIRSCLLYTSPSPRDVEESRMPSSA